MSNYSSLNLYLVSEGVVSAGEPTTECDGLNSVLVAATSPAAALRVADAYAAGAIGIDNLEWHGQTIAAATIRDADTGLYA
jgi:hypothetical protein